MLADLIGQKKSHSFLDWCKEHIVSDKGTKFTLEGRKALEEIYTEINHPNVTILKGAQVGLSTFGIAFSLWLVDQKRRNCIYYLPNDRFAKRFSATRFDPYIKRSKYLQDRLRGTDQQGLKEIDTYFLYMLGLFDVSGAISIPSDCNLYDEVDVLSQENMEWSLDRVAASDLAWLRYFSVGMIPGEGIDERYQAGDQRRWLVTCPGCGKEQFLEDEFPDNLQRMGDRVFLACCKCGREIDPETKARWTATYPERDKRSYRVPQLIIPAMNLKNIYNRWQNCEGKPSKIAKFNCSVLARPDGGNMQPITDQVLKRAIGDFYLQDSSEKPCYMGIDMGDNAHIAIAERGKYLRYIWFQEIQVEDLIPVALDLESRYHICNTVIDAMPYKPESKKLVRTLKNSGYIQYFKGESLKEKEEGEGEKAVKVVTVDRTESLNETADLFVTYPPLALLPKPKTVEDEKILHDVYWHLKKLIKEKKVNAKGDITIEYKKKVENHYGMAVNSARIASIVTGSGSFDLKNIISKGTRKILSKLRGYE